MDISGIQGLRVQGFGGGKGSRVSGFIDLGFRVHARGRLHH